MDDHGGQVIFTFIDVLVKVPGKQKDAEWKEHKESQQHANARDAGTAWIDGLANRHHQDQDPVEQHRSPYFLPH